MAAKEVVLHLVQSCKISEERAIALLQKYNNDPENVKAHIAKLSRYCSVTAPSADTVGPTPGAASHVPFPPVPPGKEQKTRSIYSLPRKAVSSLEVKPSEGKHGDHSTPRGITPEKVKAVRPAVFPEAGAGVSRVDLETTSPQMTYVVEDYTEKEWDFRLPRVAPPSSEGFINAAEGLDLRSLVGGVQQGWSAHAVSNYLKRFDQHHLGETLNRSVEGIPSIFYPVSTNDEAMVRLWSSHGGDVDAIHPSGTPLLAFAIVNSQNIRSDTTQMVAILLSLGASPQTIPPACYKPQMEELSGKKQKTGSADQSSDPEPDWFTEDVKKKLLDAINLTQQYYLSKATKTKQASQRMKQVARRRDAEPLLGIPYFLVGQSLASSRLLQKFLTHLAKGSSQKPLVLAFAGPSGHGKTELARRLGHLLSLELEIVDSTIVTKEIELFGPRKPYHGASEGSPLNNFLARHSGERSIVFFDEFEKTTPDIHQALLLPFDSGEYQDRRDRSMVDCSQTIFVLATNAMDRDIQDFCNDKEAILSDDGELRDKAAKELSKIIKNGFRSKFGASAPLTGRVSDFIFFLPFSVLEQTAVAHKFLLELCQQVREPVRLTEDSDEQLLGDVHLRLPREGAVCRAIAEASYDTNLGARSLKTAVEEVREKLTEAYLDGEDEIKEGGRLQVFALEEVGGDITVVRVS